MTEGHISTSMGGKTRVGGLSSAGLPPSVTRWYVVQTHSYAEQRALGHLARQNFHTFCPMIRKTVTHARTRRTVWTPLFPGYVFVQLDLARDRWRSINGTIGVSHILASENRPTPVPVGIVETLQSNFDKQRALPAETAMRAGDSVRVLTGPFADQIGILERLDRAGRVRVLLSIMGQTVPVALSSQLLAPAA